MRHRKGTLRFLKGALRARALAFGPESRRGDAEVGGVERPADP